MSASKTEICWKVVKHKGCGQSQHLFVIYTLYSANKLSRCEVINKNLKKTHSILGWECSELWEDVTSSSQLASWKRKRAHPWSAKIGTEESGN